MNTNIRSALLTDLETIVAYNIALAQESENLSLAQAVVHPGVKAILTDRAKGTYYVAEQEGRVVGQLLITHEWSDWRNGDFWWIQSVYVHKDFRSRGIFKSLYAHVQSEAKKQGNVCGFRLYMEEHNVPARKAYEGLGMKQTYYQVFEQILT